MTGFGEAIAYGAATIINAISTGYGAAFGVDLWTKARVRLTDNSGSVQGHIISEPSEDTLLIQEAIHAVFRYFHVDNEYGAFVETESNIPIAKGLKSSSVAANALILATIAALGRRVEDEAVLNLSVDAAINSKTTITGAFDDTCASFFGNIVVTNNIKRQILQSFKCEDLTVLFHIPIQKSYTYTSNVKRMKLIAAQVQIAFNEALSGNYWNALTLNGVLFSAALGYTSEIAMDALEAGAFASGLSGKGPATVAVIPPHYDQMIIDAWHRYGGDIIKAKINKNKAHITRQE